MQSMSASKFSIDDLLRKEPKSVDAIGQENNRGVTEIFKISNCFENFREDRHQIIHDKTNAYNILKSQFVLYHAYMSRLQDVKNHGQSVNMPNTIAETETSTLFQKRIGHPYQNRNPPKRKKPRSSFNKIQVAELEKRFMKQKYLASNERLCLANYLKMTDGQVKTWFQNRRTKWRRQAIEQKESERLVLSLSDTSASEHD